ncbi:MAG: histone deacetylase [Chloroflexota bacterium]
MRTGYGVVQAHHKHNLPGHPENARRLHSIIEHLEQTQFYDSLVAIDQVIATTDQLLRVHSQSYLDYLKRITESGGGFLDSDTYVTQHSYEIALLASGCTVEMTNRICSGDLSNGFALVRPPGHHAGSDYGMGFCLLNNIAIAARQALVHPNIEKVMILDIDVHHGNGTQDIFAADPLVLYSSIHQYPYYPGTGHHSEIGVRDGTGTVVNVPFPPYAGDMAYASAMELVVQPVTERYHPDMIFVSIGFDTHWADPLASTLLTLSGYHKLCSDIVSLSERICEGRVIFVLEGGYDPDVLGYAAENVFRALLMQPDPIDPLGQAPRSEVSCAPYIQAVRQVHQIN